MRESWIFVPHGYWFTSAKIRELKPSSGGNNSWDERELNLCAAWPLIYFSEDKRTETLKRREQQLRWERIYVMSRNGHWFTSMKIRELKPSSGGNSWERIEFLATEHFSGDKRTETLNRREQQLRWERVDFFVPSWPLLTPVKIRELKPSSGGNSWDERELIFCAVMATVNSSEDKRTETLNRREQLRWENYWSFCAVMATDWTKCKKMFGGAVRPLMHSWIF